MSISTYVTSPTTSVGVGIGAVLWGVGALTLGPLSVSGVALALLGGQLIAHGSRSLESRCCRLPKKKSPSDVLKEELYKRLPESSKIWVVDNCGNELSPSELTFLTSPDSWHPPGAGSIESKRDRGFFSLFSNSALSFSSQPLDEIRRKAILAAVQNKISKETLAQIFLHCMVFEFLKEYPSIQVISSSKMSDFQRKAEWNNFITIFRLPNSKEPPNFDLRRFENTFFIIIPSEREFKREYSRTTELSLQLYPFKPGGCCHLFPPHMLEAILKFRFNENAELPLPAIGARPIETLSDNKTRILSLTGGDIAPTPTIQSSKTLGLIFYMHDSYHLFTDSCIGSDHRNVWNTLGKRLIQLAKGKEGSEKEAIHSLAIFALDKDFSSYRVSEDKVGQLFANLEILYNQAGYQMTDDPANPRILLERGNLIAPMQHLLCAAIETTLPLQARRKLGLTQERIDSSSLPRGIKRALRT